MSEFLITANPKTPKSGRKKLFPASDGAWYEKDSTGTVKPIGLRSVDTAPSDANDTGQTGDIYSGTAGTYLCVAANTWVKLATDSFSGTSDLTTYVSDNQYFLEGTSLKVGISLNKGGALSYFGAKTGGKNYVNTKDAGRYAGVSFYSNPDPYTVSGYTAASGFENASWNPVQGGDAGNNGSPVETYNFNGSTETFYIKSKPLQWKFTGGLVENTVTIESYYTFMDGDNTLKCRFVVTVNRGSGINYPGRANETPFVYLTRDLDNIIYYAGTSPWTGGATSSATYDYTAFGAANTAAIFEPTEKWVWLNDGAGNGVGVVNFDFADNWTITKYLSTGGGVLTGSNPTMIVQQTSTYTDTGNFTFEKTMYLVLGSAAETRAFAVANH